MKIGVAIPCYHGHIPALLELLDNLKKQTRLPDKVAISCSSTNEFPKLKNYGFSIETVVTKDKKSAAENRNIASSKLMDMDYITFFDADDLMHPQRIEILCMVCQNSNPDIILHNYHNETYMLDVSPEPIDNIDVKKNSLCQCYSGCVRHREHHYGDIHHGHATVKRNILEVVRFPEEIEYHTKEDSVFCNRVVGLPNIETAYIVNKLSYYKPSRTGGIS
jgi:glycosyltransferase involved in cell wall biosynthesis